MKTPKTLLVAILALAAASPFASNAKGGAGFDIQKDGPRIERGERINWEPKAVERDPSPIERVIKEVVDSPVRPTIKDGQLAIEFRHSFP